MVFNTLIRNPLLLWSTIILLLSMSARHTQCLSQDVSSKNRYFSYKTFKRLGVPAMAYSAASNAASRLLDLKTKQVPISKVDRRQVAIVTGSNTGVGFETARTLAQKHGFEVIVACRSKTKGVEACCKINTPDSLGKAVFVKELDLSDFESVRGFSESVGRLYENIDVLVNNAGRNSVGPPSREGSIYLVFQTNFLGHFLLTNLLLEKCNRIVNLASVMHHFPKYSKHDNGNIESPEFWRSQAIDSQEGRKTIRKTYPPSKLAALLFTVELNRRYGETGRISSIAVNPGSVNSDIWRNYPRYMRSLFSRIYLSPEQGSSTSVAASILDFGKDEVYLQPYRLPFQSTDSPPYPLFEMLGPFEGYRVTNPRLPDDRGLKASRSLFMVCEELVGCTFP